MSKQWAHGCGSGGGGDAVAVRLGSARKKTRLLSYPWIFVLSPPKARVAARPAFLITKLCNYSVVPHADNVIIK